MCAIFADTESVGEKKTLPLKTRHYNMFAYSHLGAGVLVCFNIFWHWCKVILGLTEYISLFYISIHVIVYATPLIQKQT